MTQAHRPIALAVAALCLAALTLAVVAQYGFDLRPCNLCLIQRVPFALAGLAAAAALRPDAPSGRLLILAGLLLLINGGIAFYHVGVEQHWWASAVCSGGDQAQVAVSDLLAEMSRPVEAQCDQPAWSFHGITMAMLNVPFSALSGLAVLWASRKAENAA